MTKRQFGQIAALVWVSVLGGIALAWPTLVMTLEEFFPKNGLMTTIFACVLLFFFMLLVHAMISDRVLVPEKIQDEHQVQVEERRKKIEQDADTAAKAGRKKEAMQLYESGGMLMSALKVAEDLHETESMVRLYSKLGRHDRARKCYTEMKDYEGAAYESGLMGEVDQAKEYYRQAAQVRESKGATPRELAPLLNRCGESYKAAQLYEEAGMFKQAAECYDLVGDRDNFRRCNSQASAIEMYERQSGQSEKNSEAYKADLRHSGELLESVGDYFGAGEQFLEAGLPLRAAASYEKFQEWERAARAYEAGGQTDKATEMRRNVRALPQWTRPDPTGTGSGTGGVRTPFGFPSMHPGTGSSQGTPGIQYPGMPTPGTGPVQTPPYPGMGAQQPGAPGQFPYPQQAQLPGQPHYPPQAQYPGQPQYPQQAQYPQPGAGYPPQFSAPPPVVVVSAPPSMPPIPSSMPAAPFIPVAQQQFVPIYIMGGGGRGAPAMPGGFSIDAGSGAQIRTPGTDSGLRSGAPAYSLGGPIAPDERNVYPSVPGGTITPPIVGGGFGTDSRERMTQYMRQGRYIDAAECAKNDNDWIMAAALYEQGGELIAAADIYRQIGKISDAAACLEKAEDAKGAALLLLAVGRVDDAVKILVRALERRSDSHLAVFLGDVLIRHGEYAMAAKYLREIIAPEGVNSDNAEVFYRYARLFEANKAFEEAVRIYREMILAGAESEDVNKREAKLSKLLSVEEEGDDWPKSDGGRIAAASMVEDALKRALTGSAGIPLPDDEDQSIREDDTPSTNPPVRGFRFAPPADLEPAGPKERKRKTHVPMVELSLFGPSTVDSINLPSSQFQRRDEDSQSQSRPSSAPQGPLEGEKPPTEQPAAVADAPEAFARGAQNVGNRYQVVRQLARGGMGIIYEATDTVLGRSVALKVIQRSNASAEELQQFLLEARVVAQLSHPNVVTIYDVGILDMKHYIAMELIKGGSLIEWVKQEKAFQLKEALRVFIEVARGLQAAHEAGIVHRDIKPGNLLLTEKREAKIVDFGVAMLCRSVAGISEHSFSRLAGTPGYMAPEQILGEELLPRCDIYALGITLFYMLVGEPPHRICKQSRQHEIFDFTLTGKLPSLKEHRPDIPAAIEQIYRYCTALKPEDRYQSIDAFLPVVEQWYLAL